MWISNFKLLYVRLLAKLDLSREEQGDLEHRTAVYREVREDASPGSTTLLLAAVELCKKSTRNLLFYTLIGVGLVYIIIGCINYFKKPLFPTIAVHATIQHTMPSDLIFTEETKNVSAEQQVVKYQNQNSKHPIAKNASHAQFSLSREKVYVGCTIEKSFEKDKNLLNPALKNQLRVIFQNTTFLKRMSRGDHIDILYKEQKGKSNSFTILVAQLNIQGKQYQAIRYQNTSNNIAYYNLQGHAIENQFLRIPVHHYKYISSGFSKHRFDPVLHKYHAHQAVDFATPLGTPVYATSKGKIVYKGGMQGYGKTIIIKHNATYTSLYAHLSRFGKFAAGSSVSQGQVIGYVGKTGYATGPHLHYEIWVHGMRCNPLTVALPSYALNPPALKKFQYVAYQMLEDLHKEKKVYLALNMHKNRQKNLQT